MTGYRAAWRHPLRAQRSCRLTGHRRPAGVPGHIPRLGRKHSGGSLEDRGRRAGAAQSPRRPRRCAADRNRREDHAWLARRLDPPDRRRLEQPAFCAGAWRIGPAAAGQLRRSGDVALGQHGLRAVPHADPGRSQRHPALWVECAEGALPAPHRLWRLDRHDEPNRSFGRFRSRRGAHARRTRGRRFPHCWSEGSSSRMAITT